MALGITSWPRWPTLAVTVYDYHTLPALLGRSRVTLLRFWCYAGYGRFFLGPNPPVVPKPTDEANLRHVAAKTLQKALYVGFSQIGLPLQVVCFWLVPISNPGSAPRRVGRTNLWAMIHCRALLATESNSVPDASRAPRLLASHAGPLDNKRQRETGWPASGNSRAGGDATP